MFGKIFRKWLISTFAVVFALYGLSAFSVPGVSAESTYKVLTPVERAKLDENHLQNILDKKQNAPIENGISTKSSGRQSIIVEFKTDPLAKEKNVKSRLVRSFSASTTEQAINKEHEDFKKSLSGNGSAKLKSFSVSTVDFGYEYKYTFNGMALKIPGNKITAIAKLPYVKKVWKDTTVSIPKDEVKKVEKDAVANMDQSRPQIGVDKARQDFGVTGKGAKVGVLDTGIDYNHPELKDVYSGGYDYIDHDNDPMETTYKDWQKSGKPEIDPSSGSEYYTSHGTHVSGTIAASGLGIAPDVELHVYRVLGPYGSGPSSGIIAAIDQAYKDGLDVINLSLGSSDNQPYGPDTIAINNFSLAGKTAVISAGNSGPDKSSLGSPGTSPLAITVGASDSPTSTPAFKGSAGSLDLDLVNIATGLGDNVADLKGKEFNVVDCGQGLEDQFDDEALSGDADVALIQRGVNYFVDKLANAKKHGAEVVIIYNNVDQMFDYTFGSTKNYVPSFSLNKEQGDALAAALKKNPSLKLKFGSMYTVDKLGDNLADFSSRGPVGLTYDIKPDVTAPGVGIDSTAPFYINSPDDPSDYTYAYQMMDGTSMAAPHVTGVAALLIGQAKSKGLALTPDQVKTDLMSTAVPLSKPLSVFDQGAGRIDAYAALDHPTTFTVQNTSTSASMETGEKYQIPYLTGSAAFGTFFDQKAHDVTKTIKIHNSGNQVKTYKLTGVFNGSDVGAPGAGGLTLDVPKSVRVPAGGDVSINLTLHIPEGTAVNSYEGYVTAKSGKQETRIPFSATVAKPAEVAYADLDRYMTFADTTPDADIFEKPWEKDNVDGFVKLNKPQDDLVVLLFDGNSGSLIGLINEYDMTKYSSGNFKLQDVWNGTYIDINTLKTAQAAPGDYMINYWFTDKAWESATADIYQPLSVTSDEAKPDLVLDTKSSAYSVKPSDLTKETDPETGKEKEAFWIKGSLKDPAFDYLWDVWAQKYDFHGPVNGTRDAIEVVPTDKDNKPDFKKSVKIKVSEDGSFKYPIAYDKLTDTPLKFFIYGVGYTTQSSEPAFFSVKKDFNAEAEAAVVKAEISQTQSDVDAARVLVNALKDKAFKAKLTARLDAVQTAVDKATADAQALVHATQAVEQAETSHAQADVDAAKALVALLPDSDEKTALSERLAKVQEKIDTATAVDKATQAVEKAETSQSQADVDAARKLVRALPDGSDKTALTKRLNAIKVKKDAANPPAQEPDNDGSNQTGGKTAGPSGSKEVTGTANTGNKAPTATQSTKSGLLPATGDTINIWMIVLGTSLIFTAAVLYRRKKDNG